MVSTPQLPLHLNIDGFAFAELEGQRILLIDYLDACERILKTPMPLVYAIKTRRFILIFLLLLPFSLIGNWGFRAVFVFSRRLSVIVVFIHFEVPFEIWLRGYELTTGLPNPNSELIPWRAVMQAEVMSFWEWQQHFSDKQSCLQSLIKQRWPDGFICGRCGHQKGWLLQTRHVYECAGCHQHTSVTAGTLFHNTKLPLIKWLWCIYWMSTEKVSISALWLTKLIGVSWLTAHRMLRKLRVAIGDQNRLYRLSGIIEQDEAFVGGKRSGKRGRGANGKTAILVACGHNNRKPGFRHESG
jgi:Bestrophin, RFP-TM, chloride channel/Transposase zinc-ribbon domain